LENISEELYRNLEGVTTIQKRSSAKFGNPIVDMDIDQDRVRLRQSLANFGEAVKIFASTLSKLNQMRINFEKRLNNIEETKNTYSTKKELNDNINNVSIELTQQVIFFSNLIVNKEHHIH